MLSRKINYTIYYFFSIKTKYISIRHNIVIYYEITNFEYNYNLYLTCNYYKNCIVKIYKLIKIDNVLCDRAIRMLK